MPDGNVLVAGDDRSAHARDSAAKTAKLWSPATQAWTALLDTATERIQAVVCALPSHRVAAAGGCGMYKPTLGRHSGEVEPVRQQVWEALPGMAHGRACPRQLAAAGGLVAVGVNGPKVRNELYDEASGQGFMLPHTMAERR